MTHSSNLSGVVEIDEFTVSCCHIFLSLIFYMHLRTFMCVFCVICLILEAIAYSRPSIFTVGNWPSVASGLTPLKEESLICKCDVTPG